jgi:hypothetical protein
MPKGFLADGTQSWKNRTTHGRPIGNRAAQFWSKVDIRGQDECWPWEGGKNKWGYGNFWNRNASRVCLELFGRPASENTMVLHSCDNPGCVNPRHLSHGTAKENQRQKADRGRSRNGYTGPIVVAR